MDPKEGKVDAVYLWVDSSKQDFIDSKNQIAKKYKLNSYWSETRDNGEIATSIKSVRRYMPWIDNVYVVVPEGHRIPYLDKNKYGVTYVSNKQLIGKNNCPCFNSSALELFQHNIPGLHEYFLAFNDDFFIAKYSPLSDFYDFNEKKIRYYYEDFLILGKPLSQQTNNIISELTGEKYYFWATHMPRMFRKSHLEEFEKQYPKHCERTKASQFRNNQEIQIVYLYGYYLLSKDAGRFEFLPNTQLSNMFSNFFSLVTRLFNELFDEGVLETLKQIFLQFVYKKQLHKNKHFRNEQVYSLISIGNDVQKNKSNIDYVLDKNIRYVCLNDCFDTQNSQQVQRIRKENYEYFYNRLFESFENG